jgi:argininosuccinate lyase
LSWGLITAEDRDIIVKGLADIDTSIVSGEFNWRDDREDVHMNIEAVLIDFIGEPAKKLHTARSRNDQVFTNVHLWCRDSIDQIQRYISCLQVSYINALSFPFFILSNMLSFSCENHVVLKIGCCFNNGNLVDSSARKFPQ